jgi:hypothetical protein
MAEGTDNLPGYLYATNFGLEKTFISARASQPIFNDYQSGGGDPEWDFGWYSCDATMASVFAWPDGTATVVWDQMYFNVDGEEVRRLYTAQASVVDAEIVLSTPTVQYESAANAFWGMSYGVRLSNTRGVFGVEDDSWPTSDGIRLFLISDTGAVLDNYLETTSTFNEFYLQRADDTTVMFFDADSAPGTNSAPIRFSISGDVFTRTTLTGGWNAYYQVPVFDGALNKGLVSYADGFSGGAHAPDGFLPFTISGNTFTTGALTPAPALSQGIGTYSMGYGYPHSQLLEPGVALIWCTGDLEQRSLNPWVLLKVDIETGAILGEFWFGYEPILQPLVFAGRHFLGTPQNYTESETGAISYTQYIYQEALRYLGTDALVYTWPSTKVLTITVGMFDTPFTYEAEMPDYQWPNDWSWVNTGDKNPASEHYWCATVHWGYGYLGDWGPVTIPAVEDNSIVTVYAFGEFPVLAIPDLDGELVENRRKFARGPTDYTM